ncbi:MAG: PEP-CTERM sorting domain-containing protein [Bdellovibrionales bacterium]|nr:PEP-CTERM sorting domain-containing protein [Bdellovibrionales bacterium]
MKYRLLAIAFAVAAAVVPASAHALSFKYDTRYALTGSFVWNPFGTATFQDGSFLFYDSATDRLTIDASFTTNLGQGSVFELSYLLGEANPRNATEVNGAVELARANSKVELDYAPGATVKDGRTQIGLFTIPNNTSIGAGRGARPFAAGDYMVFSTGMNPFIFEDNGRLIFQSWVGVWGQGWDVHTDPRFYLTEMSRPTPPGEIPEPFTLGLLASGLLGGAVVRRRAQ